MRRFLLATAGVAVLALGACANNKPVRAPNTTLPAQFTQGGDADVALDHWWTVYNDPERTRMVETALVTAPDAQLIQQRAVRVVALRCASLFLRRGLLRGGFHRRHLSSTGAQLAQVDAR